jgi:hypothetical protein
MFTTILFGLAASVVLALVWVGAVLVTVAILEAIFGDDE